MCGKVAQIIAARRPEGVVGMVLRPLTDADARAGRASARYAALLRHPGRSVTGAFRAGRWAAIARVREQVIEDTLRGVADAK
jgi:hypothetical protein